MADAEKTKKNVVAVVLSDEQKAALEKMHDESGAPVSFYVRKAIAEFLNISHVMPKKVSKRASKKSSKETDDELAE